MIYFHIIPILKWPLIPTSLLSYVESFFNDPNPIEKRGGGGGGEGEGAGGLAEG